MQRIGFFLTLMIIIFGFTFVSAQSPQGSASEVYDFPADHRFHSDDPTMNENYLEWFYYTGILDDQNGDMWGVQFTIFRGRPPHALRREAYFYDIALSDPHEERYLHYRGFWFDAGQTVDYGDIWQFDNGKIVLKYVDEQDQWFLGFDGDMDNVATGEDYPVTIDLQLNNDQLNYYYHGGTGLYPIGDCEQNIDTLDGYTYYYTHPALTTDGTIVVEDELFSVTGDTWFDHQWGNFVHCPLTWDWFSFRFDDGSYMMLFAEWDANYTTPKILGATYIQSDGNAEYWVGADLEFIPLRDWTHPDSGVLFTIEWEVTTPLGTFGVVPLFDYQAGGTFEGIPDYWEGLINIYKDGIDGDQVGIGYLEVAR